MKTIKYMKNSLLVLLLLSGSALEQWCCGDDWVAIKPREFWSKGGSDFVFVVTPDHDYVGRPGHCKASLFQVHRGGHRTPVWSRCLINNIGPVKVLVSTLGRYVVTIDEWGDIGAIPVAIYGNNGRLIRSHCMESLGMPEVGCVEKMEWSKSSLAFLDPKEQALFIRLKSGRLLMINLCSGDLMSKEWYERHRGWDIKEAEWNRLKSFGHDNSIKVAVEMLSSRNVDDRLTGLIVVSQEGYRNAIPKLKALLSDNDYVLVKIGDQPEKKVFRVRKAAKEVLHSMGEEVDDNIVIEEIPGDEKGAEKTPVKTGEK